MPDSRAAPFSRQPRCPAVSASVQPTRTRALALYRRVRAVLACCCRVLIAGAVLKHQLGRLSRQRGRPLFAALSVHLSVSASELT
jgi:hypothetical protein